MHGCGTSVKYIHQKYKDCEKVALETHQESKEQPIYLAARAPDLFSPLTRLFSASPGEAAGVSWDVLSTEDHFLSITFPSIKIGHQWPNSGYQIPVEAIHYIIQNNLDNLQSRQGGFKCVVWVSNCWR